MNTRLLRLLRARRGLLKLLRERPISGSVLSLLVHGGVVVLILWFGLPMAQPRARPGEALFVELPQLPEPAPRGNPSVRERGPDGASEPSRPTPPALPPPAAVAAPKAAPPTPTRGRAEAPPPPAPSRPAEPAPPRVASAPRSPDPVAPRPTAPAPPPEPSAAPAPAPSAPEARAPQAAPVPSAPPPPAPSPPAPAAPGIAWPPRPEAPGLRGGPAVAAIPGAGVPGRETAPDMKSALRRGAGAGGGSRDGRGGIEGEPIPLDSKDPKYSDYLDRVREMIKAKWIYPCVPNPASRQCEYKSAALEIEFGIAKDGRVPFVIVRQASQFGIYDEYAVNAIKLASPFPPVPDDLSKKGIPILARFNYVLESYSLTNLLR